MPSSSPSPPPPQLLPAHLYPLATLTPPPSSTSSSTKPRTWQSAPHPTLPLLATSSSSRSAHVFSLSTFVPLSTVSGGHKRSVRCVAWQPPGGRSARTSTSTSGLGAGAGAGEDACILATGSFDATVGIWKRDEGVVAARAAAAEANDDDDDGGGGGLNSDEGATDAEDEWAFTVLLTGHDSEIKSVAFCPVNPSLLATCSRDKSVWIWEEISADDDYETVAVLSEHEGDVKCVAWSPSVDGEGGECLASCGYDDEVRVWRDVEGEGEWGCVGRIQGHGGTVWCVVWEPPPPLQNNTTLNEIDGQGRRGGGGKRLATCSDDLTVRIWRRELPSQEPVERRTRLPSIIRPAPVTETWVAHAVLPKVHFRSIYSIAWSERSGLLASCGGDGSLFVYQEVERNGERERGESGGELNGDGNEKGDEEMSDSDRNQDQLEKGESKRQSEWKVVAGMEEAHAEYEINHVCWARRVDRGRRTSDEEVLVSTGDDGNVKVWTLPEELLVGDRIMA